MELQPRQEKLGSLGFPHVLHCHGIFAHGLSIIYQCTQKLAFIYSNVSNGSRSRKDDACGLGLEPLSGNRPSHAYTCKMSMAQVDIYYSCTPCRAISEAGYISRYWAASLFLSPIDSKPLRFTHIDVWLLSRFNT